MLKVDLDPNNPSIANTVHDMFSCFEDSFVDSRSKNPSGGRNWIPSRSRNIRNSSKPRISSILRSRRRMYCDCNMCLYVLCSHVWAAGVTHTDAKGFSGDSVGRVCVFYFVLILLR
jgi:hypothetical protein